MARRKNNPVAEQVEMEIMDIAVNSDSDMSILHSVLSILEKINFCNGNGLYSTAELAIKKGIARCNVEIDFANAICENGKETELYRSLCKKYGVKPLI